MKGCLLISIIMLPNAIFLTIQVIAKPGMFNFSIKASVSSKLMMIHHFVGVGVFQTLYSYLFSSHWAIMRKIAIMQ